MNYISLDPVKINQKYMLSSIKYIAIVMLSTTFMLWSCVSAPEVEDSEEIIEEANDEVEANEGEKIVYYGTPSLVEVASLMKSTGVVFTGEMMNDLNEASNYNEQHIKALNLGVYGADLTYSAMFDHTQEAINYLKLVPLYALLEGVLSFTTKKV